MFVAYGQRYGLRADHPDLLERLAARVPFGWRPTDDTAAGISTWYTFRRLSRPPALYQLIADDTTLIESVDMSVVLDEFERHAELVAAERSSDSLFVHAGVMAWRDRAIVVPGSSGTGKTSLVRAFLAAGATYLSDEFARFDGSGRVHPYARPLSLRGADRNRVPMTAADLGSTTATSPLPVRLILLTSYRPDAIWEPRLVSPARALVALMEQTVAARRDAAYSMPILKAVVTRAMVLESQRPEATDVVREVLFGQGAEF